MTLQPPISQADSIPPLADMTPWEFACLWYRPSEIAHSIARGRNGFEHNAKVPTDIYSQEFADWLTEQYRLAMAKGIQIGSRSTTSSPESRSTRCK